jgi:hypothetical protein
MSGKRARAQRRGRQQVVKLTTSALKQLVLLWQELHAAVLRAPGHAQPPLMMDAKLANSLFSTLASAARLVNRTATSVGSSSAKTPHSASQPIVDGVPAAAGVDEVDEAVTQAVRQKKAIVAMAWQVWNQLQSDAATAHDDQDAANSGESIQVLSSLVTVMSRAGCKEDCARALQEVMKSSVRRDEVFYSSLLEACADAAEPETAQMIMNMMQKAKHTHSEPVAVTTRHFNALIRAYARAGGTWASTGAWDQLHTMTTELTPPLVPDEYTVSALLAACESVQDPDRALHVLRFALQHSRPLAVGKSNDDSRRGVRATPALLRHAHRLFNCRWAWRRRPQAMELMWSIWDSKSQRSRLLQRTRTRHSSKVFPWWHGDHPVGAEEHVGRRVSG